MAALDRAVEGLRALVKTNAWDYCIVWKLGDDPSSFIEWRGCCCSGGNGLELINVKEESGNDQYLFAQCRDEHVQHAIRTKACEKLSKFPLSIPLYSGVHGEVVMSNQARWHTNTKNTSTEAIGTQVLVPVAGGLVELFSTKLVPKNQQIIDFILTQYISVELETMASHSCTGLSVVEPLYKAFLDDYFNNLPTSVHDLNSVPIPNLQCPTLVSNSSFRPSFEGSSTSSNLPKDYRLLNLGSGLASCTTSPEKSSGRYPGDLTSRKTKDASCGYKSAKLAAETNDNLKGRKKTERENYHSKNLITERNRRHRINHGLLTLRSLVPNISKMDKAATLSDAYDYIQELQKSVQKYQDELRDLAEQECSMYIAEPVVPKLYRELERTDDQPTIEHDSRCHSSTNHKKQKVEIEVSQIGPSDFLVKIICTQKRGGFLELMQAMDSSGLQVIDANVTTSNGLVLNILKVEAFGKEFQPTTLKDSLMEIFQQDG